MEFGPLPVQLTEYKTPSFRASLGTPWVIFVLWQASNDAISTPIIMAITDNFFIII
jgi:hypothetical protein